MPYSFCFLTIDVKRLKMDSLKKEHQNRYSETRNPVFYSMHSSSSDVLVEVLFLHLVRGFLRLQDKSFATEPNVRPPDSSLFIQ